MDPSDWFGGATVRADSWDNDTIWNEDNIQDDTERPVSLHSLDPNFIRDLLTLKHHCYDITVTQDPLDSERAQRMEPLQDYITLLSKVHTLLRNAPHGTTQDTSLPASVQINMVPLLEWIRHFCETNRDPVDRIPFQSHLRANLIENPYVQSKIME